MSKKKRVVDLVQDIAGPYCKENSLELVDVEFVKEGPHRYLRVMIDKEGGVSLDDCQLVSRFLNKKMDKLDPIEEMYFLEVTSPGVERELKRDEDFEKYIGHKVQVKLFQPIEGQKVFTGTIKSYQDGKFTLEREEGSDLEIPRSKAAVVKLVVDFN